jgi:hypothetical protein
MQNVWTHPRSGLFSILNCPFSTLFGQTQMVAHLTPAGGSDPTRFQPADVQVLHRDDGTPERCRCPAGQVTTTFHRSRAGDGVHARFTVTQHCADCALWTQCRPPDGKPTSHRTVFLSDYQHHLRTAATVNASETGQTLLANRWRVEPVVSWLVQYQGCRRARRVGQAAAQFQLHQASAVRNLLQWLNRRTRAA